MKPFTGITRCLRPNLTARVAQGSFGVLKLISSSIRCKSTLDNAPPLPKLEFPDAADATDSSQLTSLADAKASGQPRRQARWTTDEYRILKESDAKGMSTKAIAALLPTRTFGAVNRQREILRYKGEHYGEQDSTKWSADSMKLLLKLHADGHSLRSLYSHFPDRSIASIKKRLALHDSRASASVLRAGSPWSEEDERRLTELYSQGVHKKPAMSQALGRSIRAIENKASALGLQYAMCPKKYSSEEIAMVLQMRHDGSPFKPIAAKLGRSRAAVAALYREHRPLQDSDAKASHLSPGQLSLDELESVSALRAQEVPWHEIGRRYPMHDLNLIVQEYRRDAGHDLSSTEVREVEFLRHEGQSWREIFESKYFQFRTESTLVKAYRRTVERQKSRQ